MANIIQLEQQKGNKLCADLLDDFNLRHTYIFIGYSNKIKPEIKIDLQDYCFYMSELGLPLTIYLPFIYKQIPINLQC